MLKFFGLLVLLKLNDKNCYKVAYISNSQLEFMLSEKQAMSNSSVFLFSRRIYKNNACFQESHIFAKDNASRA